MKSTRVFQITALVLVLVSVVQVGWWTFDQQTYMARQARETNELYAQQVAAAQALLDKGVAVEEVHQILPAVVVNGTEATLSPRVAARTEEESRRRLNQYAWESAFFLLALGVCIAVIWRALRAEAKVLQAQDSFLALVSHQFKTPLASLQLSLETMAMRTLSPEEQRKLTDRMLADLERMESMVTRILDSVRLEQGRVDLRREPLELASAVARVVSQFEERARERRITISMDVPRGLEVLADPLAVDVVIRNLVENAIAAVAPLGGGTITLVGQRRDGEVELSIRDSGVGFRPADRSRLFEKFARLHPGGGSSEYGTGLGLYIVRRMMQLAGGRVSAHSEGLGRGAQFVLAWPAAPTEAS